MRADWLRQWRDRWIRALVGAKAMTLWVQEYREHRHITAWHSLLWLSPSVYIPTPKHGRVLSAKFPALLKRNWTISAITATLTNYVSPIRTLSALGGLHFYDGFSSSTALHCSWQYHSGELEPSVTVGSYAAHRHPCRWCILLCHIAYIPWIPLLPSFILNNARTKFKPAGIVINLPDFPYQHTCSDRFFFSSFAFDHSNRSIPFARRFLGKPTEFPYR